MTLAAHHDNVLISASRVRISPCTWSDNSVAPPSQGERSVKLPKIDLESLPVLEAVQGIFGSLSDLAQASPDDRIIVLMVYIYELIPEVMP